MREVKLSSMRRYPKKERVSDKSIMARIIGFATARRTPFLMIILCLLTFVFVYTPKGSNGNREFVRNKELTDFVEHQIQSRALKRASWKTALETPDQPRRKTFSFFSRRRPRRAFVSSLYTEDYFPLCLAMGYSLAQTNDMEAQDAEMVLFIRQGANVSTAALDKLERVGWKLRIEEDLEFEDVDFDKIRPWHRWNLNKLRFWSWIEYDQILFIDSDTLVKSDLSEIWSTPGSKPSLLYGNSW